MTDRLCKKCLRWLPVAQFPPDQPSRATGQPTRRYTCRDCERFARLCRKTRPVADTWRTCRTCQVEKPLADFHKNNRGGREWQCKVCKHTRQRADRRAQAAADPQRAAERRARRALVMQRWRMRRALARATR